MIFDSIAFFVFFPIVVALFFGTPERWRWVVLLAASGVFYAWWKPEYVIVLFVATTVAYVAGRMLAGEGRAARRRTVLGVALLAQLGMLFFFKYLRFFFPGARAVVDLGLPIGISFYTFQTIGYVVDVYRGQYEPERHYGRFALFVSFFPHLVAGPIMRGNVLLPQFQRAPRWDTERAVSGMKLVLFGLFKKVVIADRAAFFVDAVYRDPDHFQGATLVVTTYIFAYQLYADFSGYSDIAIGTARVLGYELSPNFDRPFASTSIIEFWRRWHISFSTWFSDYVYAPLGLALGRIQSPLLAGKRGRALRTGITVAIVFVLSGLWHGASWNFILWGATMGSFMIVALAARALWKRSKAIVGPPYAMLARAIGVVVTFNLVAGSLVLFRAPDIAHVKTIVGRLGVDYHVSIFWELTHVGPAPASALAIELGVLVVSIAAMEVAQWIMATPGRAPLPIAARWLAWSALSVWCILAAVQTHSPFIYFAF